MEIRGDWEPTGSNPDPTLNAEPAQTTNHGSIITIRGDISTGSGLFINTYGGADTVNLYSEASDSNTTVMTRAGADLINIYKHADAGSGKQTVVHAGDGADIFTFNLEATSAGTLTAFGDDGDDLFQLVQVIAGSVALQGNAGKDTFQVGSDSCSAATYVTLDGGADDDTWIFSPHWGQIDSITDPSGDDTLDFSGVGATEKLRFYIAKDYLTVAIGNVNPADGIANSLTHTGNTIEHLIGGQANDSFHFADGAELASHDSTTGKLGTIDGKDSLADLIDYTEYQTGVTVNLGTQTATGLSSISNIENVTGGQAADSLSGDDKNNVLTGGPGNDTLAGAKGNDAYLFLDNWGSDTLTENAGEGSDTLNFYGYDGNHSNYFYSYGGDTITYVTRPVTVDLKFVLSN
jgi:Ca2+-binding RTX toxin-like protein